MKAGTVTGPFSPPTKLYGESTRRGYSPTIVRSPNYDLQCIDPYSLPFYHGRTGALADPSKLPPLNGDSTKNIQVVIETPKASRNKYAFDEKLKGFQLRKVLPAGMTFPYDFGFIPSTLAEDGDPVDVLVLMDEAAFAGCILQCRPVGVIEGQQGKKKEKCRNDRIVAIAELNHSYAHIKHVRDLGKHFIRELEDFFVNYHELTGKKYKILDVKGPAEAWRRIEDGIKAAKRRR